MKTLRKLLPIMERINFILGRSMFLVKKTPEATFYIKTTYEGHIFGSGSLGSASDEVFFLHSEVEDIGKLTDLESTDWRIEKSKFYEVMGDATYAVRLLMDVGSQVEENKQ